MYEKEARTYNGKGSLFNGNGKTDQIHVKNWNCTIF